MAMGSIKKITLQSAKKILPRRKMEDNKSSAGKSLIIAGSRGMFGAAVLAATAAYRVGSGYVTVMTDVSKFSSSRHPEFLTMDWKEKIPIDLKFAICIGPGLGQTPRTKRLLQQLLKNRPPYVVVDADALNLCSEYEWYNFPVTWIATPHEGELARLLKVSAKWIRENRLLALEKAQRKLGCVILLKGAKTLISNGENVAEIQSGNPSLAKAGTGDVLSGMITGFLAQGLLPFAAATLGAYVHGRMADDWIKSGRDVLSLMPSDLVSALPVTLFKIRKSAKKLAE
jgi:ADP-dependent NAD(P)H-hydrate dehydratase